MDLYINPKSLCIYQLLVICWLPLCSIYVTQMLHPMNQVHYPAYLDQDILKISVKGEQGAPPDKSFNLSCKPVDY